MMKQPLLMLVLATAVAGCVVQTRDTGYVYPPSYGNSAYDAPYDNGGYGQQVPDNYAPDANAYDAPQEYGSSGSYDSNPVDVSFDGFYRALAPYGRWYRHPRWGDVWRPEEAGPGFRPYYRGHWEDTQEFGWTWISDYEWGDIPFHYGRWVYDPDDGWLWIPGYVWSPAWVVWRSGDGYVGWFPMPPDDGFLSGSSVYTARWDDWGSGFGYRDWYGPAFGADTALSFWVFVDERHFADRDFHPYIPQRDRYAQIVNRSVNATNYVTVNNYIVNRSVDPGRIARASGRRIDPRPASQFFRRGVPATRVNFGEQVDRRERRDHGGDPHASPRERITVLNPPPRDSVPPRAFTPPGNAAPPADRDFRGGDRGFRGADRDGTPAQEPNRATFGDQGRPDFDRRDRGNAGNSRTAPPPVTPPAPAPQPAAPVIVNAPPPNDAPTQPRGFPQRGRRPGAQAETNASPPAAVPATESAVSDRDAPKPRAVADRKPETAPPAQPASQTQAQPAGPTPKAADAALPADNGKPPLPGRTTGRGRRRAESEN